MEEGGLCGRFKEQGQEKKKSPKPSCILLHTISPSNSLQVLHLGTQQTTDGKYFLRKFRNFKKEKLEFANADNDYIAFTLY